MSFYPPGCSSVGLGSATGVMEGAGMAGGTSRDLLYLGALLLLTDFLPF